MNIHFSIQEKINTFTIQERIEPSDAEVLKQSLFRFFNSKPVYVILDLSLASPNLPESDLQHVLSEIKTSAETQDIFLVIAQTDIESLRAPIVVTEKALYQKINSLQSKLELFDEVKQKTKKILEENEFLKNKILLSKSDSDYHVNPLLEKLWSEK